MALVVAGAVLPAVIPSLHDLGAIELVFAQLQVDPVVHLAHPAREGGPVLQGGRVLLQVLP